jgi:predicted nucleic acid-binding protein
MRKEAPAAPRAVRVPLSWCFDDEGGDYALRVLDHLSGSEAIVPALWTLEVANGLLAAERRRRLDSAEGAGAGQLLLSLPIVVEPLDRSRPLAWVQPLARKHGLSVYDAAYLELSVRRGIPLATLDTALREAALAQGPGLLEV